MQLVDAEIRAVLLAGFRRKPLPEHHGHDVADEAA